MMRHPGARRTIGRLAVACAVLVGSAGTAFAQLDPLLFLKMQSASTSVKPNVLFVVDVANRMQRDANNDYYDQAVYTRTFTNWELVLGVTDANTNVVNGHYRRKYINLRNLDTSLGTDKFETNTITVVGDLQSGFSTFDAATRLGITRVSLSRALQLNTNVARFGLIQMRQAGVALGALGNEGPVYDDDPNQASPTDSNPNRWHITRATVALANSQAPSSYPLVAPEIKCDSATANSDVVALFGKAPFQGGLIPAGRDAVSWVDAPVKYMLDDAKLEATRLINADISAGIGGRNTVVVLVVGGGEGSLSGADPAAAASAFLNISSRRVPIYVIAIAPLDGSTGQPISDAGRQALRAIATNSGGQYFEITSAMISAVNSGSAVPEFVRAVNAAIQHTFASQTDFNTAPSATLPYGPSTEYQTTSPIIGTVNLSNSVDINGNALPYSVIYKGPNVIPQRSNVLVTTAVAVPGGDVNTPSINTPGFFGLLRAFRVFRPTPDATQPAGYKFVGDGTALWVARAPKATEGTRNIYTALPNGTIVPFTTDNAATLAPYLHDADASGAFTSERAAGLISYIRGLPLGGFIDSTPAFLDAPSLDPPPDSDYPAFIDLCQNRRTLIFIGANDGMLHAIDARTGVEVWAFIPFNLLPKLRALRSGQPVDQFRFFADGSAKVADVKVGGAWHTYMVFGEGPGGTFYQTFDVTMATLGDSIAPDSSNVGPLLTYFSSPTSITFKWSFPSYAHFNYTATTPPADYYVAGTTSTVTPYGDLDKNLATAIEKSVGQTWSDPAVGQVKTASGSWVTLVGSGFLPYSQQHQVNRGDAPAGTTFYVLDMATGAVLDSRIVSPPTGNDGVAEFIDNCAISADITKGSAGDCTKQRNALQSDPVATGPPNSRFIDTAYIGDLDGNLWRFSLGLTGANVATISSGPTKLYAAGNTQPIFSSMAVVNVGGTQQYVFFGTGSDLLPSIGCNNLAYELVGVLDQNGSGTQKFALSLSKIGSGADEKVSAYPAVAGDIVFFTTTTFKTATPWVLPDANVYALTFIGGPAYDNTGDNTVTSKDTPKVLTLAGAGRATAPFVADQHLVLAAGGRVDMLGDPQDFNNGVGQQGVRILSWREIR